MTSRSGHRPLGFLERGSNVIVHHLSWSVSCVQAIGSGVPPQRLRESSRVPGFPSSNVLKACGGTGLGLRPQGQAVPRALRSGCPTLPTARRRSSSWVAMPRRLWVPGRSGVRFQMVESSSRVRISAATTYTVPTAASSSSRSNWEPVPIPAEQREWERQILVFHQTGRSDLGLGRGRDPAPEAAVRRGDGGAVGRDVGDTRRGKHPPDGLRRASARGWGSSGSHESLLGLRAESGRVWCRRSLPRGCTASVRDWAPLGDQGLRGHRDFRGRARDAHAEALPPRATERLTGYGGTKAGRGTVRPVCETTCAKRRARRSASILRFNSATLGEDTRRWCRA